MPEQAPKYTSESPEKLMSLQNDQLSKMLANFHLQHSLTNELPVTSKKKRKETTARSCANFSQES